MGERNVYLDQSPYYSRECPFRMSFSDPDDRDCIKQACMAWIEETVGGTSTGRGRCGMVHPIIPLMTNPV